MYAVISPSTQGGSDAYVRVEWIYQRRNIEWNRLAVAMKTFVTRLPRSGTL